MNIIQSEIRKRSKYPDGKPKKKKSVTKKKIYKPGPEHFYGKRLTEMSGVKSLTLNLIMMNMITRTMKILIYFNKNNS